jgi:hypothetical protein
VKVAVMVLKMDTHTDTCTAGVSYKPTFILSKEASRQIYCAVTRFLYGGYLIFTKLESALKQEKEKFLQLAKVFILRSGISENRLD